MKQINLSIKYSLVLASILAVGCAGNADRGANSSNAYSQGQNSGSKALATSSSTGTCGILSRTPLDYFQLRTLDGKNIKVEAVGGGAELNTLTGLAKGAKMICINDLKVENDVIKLTSVSFIEEMESEERCGQITMITQNPSEAELISLGSNAISLKSGDGTVQRLFLEEAQKEINFWCITGNFNTPDSVDVVSVAFMREIEIN